MNGSAGSHKKDDIFLIIPRWIYALSSIIDTLILLVFSISILKIEHLTNLLILYTLYIFICLVYIMIGMYLHELAHKWAYTLLGGQHGYVIIRILPVFRFYRQITVPNFKIVLIAPTTWFGILSLPVIGSLFLGLPAYAVNGLFAGYLIIMAGSLGDLYLFCKTKHYNHNWIVYPFRSKRIRGFKLKHFSSPK